MLRATWPNGYTSLRWNPSDGPGTNRTPLGEPAQPEPGGDLALGQVEDHFQHRALVGAQKADALGVAHGGGIR